MIDDANVRSILLVYKCKLRFNVIKLLIHFPFIVVNKGFNVFF